ncbi:serine hydrolase [Paenibacillus sp. SC116]|uniref:serine hydrolase n=1 Tax=Paenibacillus sp. SC116 TaxID=2968986 RepID=UPI00215B2872|nr:serine hydrolase [Paenibacillus sp. SC116]MCR8845868.1 serine hydrolase [Paenibacillus sp. SC116]
MSNKHKQSVINNLDLIINDFVVKESVPGLAIGVVYNKETIYTKGFGVKNVDTKEPVSERSLFHMASVSKTFVSLGIMQLVEQGKLDLDASVVAYLPYFQLQDDRYDRITIRQMLSHVSGMPDEDEFNWDKPQFDDEALERYVKSVRDRSLMWEPGTKYAYSNMAYEVLGDVIHKVSGKSFEQYMKDHILDVLGMNDSHFLKLSVPHEMLVTPHVLGIEEGYTSIVSHVFPYNRSHGPSSTLISNPIEMCRYALAHLQHGSLDGARILEPTSYHTMWQSHAPTGMGGIFNEMCLGWYFGEYKGHRVFTHSGRDTGFRSNFIVMPDLGAAVVLMINSDYIGMQILYASIMDVLLGEEVPYTKQSLARLMAKTIINDGIAKAWDSYHAIQSEGLEPYLLIEGEFNHVAYELMRAGRLNDAIDMLSISLAQYPESSNLHDSMGEMLLMRKDKQLALEHYQRSVELDPSHEEGIRMIEKLLNE